MLIKVFNGINDQNLEKNEQKKCDHSATKAVQTPGEAFISSLITDGFVFGGIALYDTGSTWP